MNTTIQDYELDLIVSGDIPLDSEVKQNLQNLITELESNPNHPIHKYKGWIAGKEKLYELAGVENTIDSLDSKSPFYHTIVITAGSCISKAKKGEMTQKERVAIVFELKRIISQLSVIDIEKEILNKESRIQKYKPILEKL